VSSSPPSNSSKKRPSPAESLNAIGKPVSAIPDYLTASVNTTFQPCSDTESERQGSPKSAKSSRRIKFTMKNQGVFDNDGRAYVPLLDRRQESLYRAYRAAYADLLFVWGMPLERRVVLKIDASSESYPDQCHGSQHAEASPVFIRRNSGLSMPVALLQDYQYRENQGLDLQRHCTKCGYALQVSVFSPLFLEKRSHKNKVSTGLPALNCPQCKPKQSLPARISCVICGEIVHGMFTPCLNCGHVSCVDCHRQWFSGKPRQDVGDEGKMTTDVPSCATGCGCNCFEHVIIQVPKPPLPSTLTEDRRQSKKQSRSRSRRPLQLDHRHDNRPSFEPSGRNGGDHPDRRPGSSFVSRLSGGLNLDLHQRVNGFRRSGTASGSASSSWIGKANGAGSL
jgi:hypothetical protein